MLESSQNIQIMSHEARISRLLPTLASHLPELIKEVASIPYSDDYLQMLYDHSHWTLLHSERTGIRAYLIAQQHRPAAASLIFAGALLHDIGKGPIARDYPGILDSTQCDLSPERWDTIKKHPRIGFDLLKADALDVARLVVRHHEYQDTPYPRSYPRDEDQNGVIVALSDGLDAGLSQRPYKQALPFEVVKRQLLANPFFQELEREIDTGYHAYEELIAA